MCHIYDTTFAAQNRRDGIINDKSQGCSNYLSVCYRVWEKRPKVGKIDSERIEFNINNRQFLFFYSKKNFYSNSKYQGWQIIKQTKNYSIWFQVKNNYSVIKTKLPFLVRCHVWRHLITLEPLLISMFNPYNHSLVHMERNMDYHLHFATFCHLFIFIKITFLPFCIPIVHLHRHFSHGIRRSRCWNILPISFEFDFPTKIHDLIWWTCLRSAILVTLRYTLVK